MTPGILAAVIGVLGLCTYLIRLTPGAGWYDSPEFVGVGTLLGIAHPTGYPLYSIVGRISAILMIPLGEPAIRLHLLSALFGSATISVLFLATWNLLGLLNLGPIPRYVRLAAAAVPALVMGAIPLFVEQAIAAEVYTLHTLVISLLLLAGLSSVVRAEHQAFLARGSGDGPMERGIWKRTAWPIPFAAAYVAGLGMGNHLTLVLYLPALALLVWWSFAPTSAPGALLVRPRMSNVARGVLPLAVMGLVGLTVYAFIPIRASLNPPFNWGGVDTFGNLVRLVTAAEARGREAQFDPVTVGSIWVRMAAGMSWPVLGMSLLGWVWAAIRRPRLGLFAGLYLAFPLLFLLLQLDILEDALLPVHLLVSMGTAVTSVLIAERLVAMLGTRRGGPVTVVLIALLVVIGPLVSTVKGWSRSAPSEESGSDIYTQALVASVAGEPEPSGEVRGWVFAEGNTTAFLLWEQARVRQVHPNLRGIYLLLAREEWYRQELRRRAPSLTVPGLPPGVEQQPHQLAGAALVRANTDAGIPIFLDPVVLPPPTAYGELVPQGIVMRVEEEGYQPSAEDVRRHASIIQRWSPAFAEEPPELDSMSADVWSYQHRLLGDAWAQLGAPEPAEVEYRASLRLNPERAQTWYMLAQFYSAVGNWPGAAATFEGALELAPGDPELSFGLARAFAMEGRYLEADSLLADDPPQFIPEAQFLQVRATIRGGLGSLTAARADLQRAAELEPDSGTIQNDLGVILLRTGQRAEAREAFEQAVRSDPGPVEAWANLGSLAYEDGRLEEAERAFQQAIEGGGMAPQLRQLFATLLLRRSDLAGAEAALRENLRLWNTYADSYLTLGAVLEARGQRQEAISIYEIGRMVAPGDARFAGELRRLRSIPPR